MLTIATPTGQIGRALVRRLLDAHVPLRLIARNPEKPIVKEALARGALVFRGSLDDRELLERSLEGASALFWLTPPSYDAKDLVARYAEFGECAADAIRAAGVPRVVHCSSFGAHLDGPIGPIRGNRAVERALDRTGAHVVHLRPSYFMDNDLWAIPSIRGASSIFLPISGAKRIPRIATRDIAKEAAALLLESSFEGRSVIELEGPARVTFDENAAAISRVLERTISHVTVSASSAQAALRSIGLSEDAAARVVELYEALESGYLGNSPSTPPRKTNTTIDAFAREVFLPAYRASAP
jgi:uncharacterized protein YbjT (DUF2867 family)